jgi:hypothetical protein
VYVSVPSLMTTVSGQSTTHAHKHLHTHTRQKYRRSVFRHTCQRWFLQSLLSPFLCVCSSVSFTFFFSRSYTRRWKTAQQHMQVYIQRERKRGSQRERKRPTPPHLNLVVVNRSGFRRCCCFITPMSSFCVCALSLPFSLERAQFSHFKKTSNLFFCCYSGHNMSFLLFLLNHCMMYTHDLFQLWMISLW